MTVMISYGITIPLSWVLVTHCSICHEDNYAAFCLLYSGKFRWEINLHSFFYFLFIVDIYIRRSCLRKTERELIFSAHSFTSASPREIDILKRRKRMRRKGKSQVKRKINDSFSSWREADWVCAASPIFLDQSLLVGSHVVISKQPHLLPWKFPVTYFTLDQDGVVERGKSKGKKLCFRGIWTWLLALQASRNEIFLITWCCCVFSLVQKNPSTCTHAVCVCWGRGERKISTKRPSLL